MSARTNALAAADAVEYDPHDDGWAQFRKEVVDAVFDSVLASLDIPEMREAVRTATCVAPFVKTQPKIDHSCRNLIRKHPECVLAAVRAELAKEDD